MKPEAFNVYTERLRASLESHTEVVGLVTLGSTADASLRDEWSDHDFWVITQPGAQDSVVEDLSWLPDPQNIAITVSHGRHRRTVVYRDRHKVEFAVFDAEEGRTGKVERYEILIDRSGIGELIESIHRNSLAEAHVRPEALENLCVMVWSACERYGRGELLTARQYIDGFAVNLLLSLISNNKDGDQARDALDPRRRLEQRSPKLAAELLTIRDETVPQAGLHLLQIAERELKTKSATLAWEKVTMVQTWIRDFSNQLQLLGDRG
jgi:lincosamide nucleotidyltransferase B/F